MARKAPANSCGTTARPQARGLSVSTTCRAYSPATSRQPSLPYLTRPAYAPPPLRRHTVINGIGAFVLYNAEGVPIAITPANMAAGYARYQAS